MSGAAEFRFSHRLRVRWSETDPQGIVFNAHYLTYFDVAITEYWRAIGCAYPAGFVGKGVDTFAVKATVEYHAPARFDDELDVRVRVARLGRTSIKLLLDVHRDTVHLVSGELIYVVASVEERRPTPIPDSIRETIFGFEITPPERAH